METLWNAGQHPKLFQRRNKTRQKIFFAEFMRLADFKRLGDRLLERVMKFDLAAPL